MNKNKDFKSLKALLSHRKIIQRKNFLNKLYEDFYNEFSYTKIPKGITVELGSGGGFLKKIMSQVITSDIIKAPHIDQVIDATNLPFKNKSISAFFMFDVFHHIKDPKKALAEFERCLITGGKVIMIEPYNSFFGSFVYRHFHHETFDPQAQWKMGGYNENQALPWIVFVRDRKIFESNFPHLKINKVTPHTPLRYIISGGLSKPQLLPSFTYNSILFIEKILLPFNSILGLFVTIELQKTQ